MQFCTPVRHHEVAARWRDTWQTCAWGRSLCRVIPPDHCRDQLEETGHNAKISSVCTEWSWRQISVKTQITVKSSAALHIWLICVLDIISQPDKFDTADLNHDSAVYQNDNHFVRQVAKMCRDITEHPESCERECSAKGNYKNHRLNLVPTASGKNCYGGSVFFSFSVQFVSLYWWKKC